MKRWLKYGLIFVIVEIILTLLLALSGNYVSYNLIELIQVLSFFISPFLTLFMIGNKILLYILSAIYWFIIGAIIGLIVNKIKSRKDIKFSGKSQVKIITHKQKNNNQNI